MAKILIYCKALVDLPVEMERQVPKKPKNNRYGLKWLLLLLSLDNTAFAQLRISGEVSDLSTGRPVAFVSIGIAGKTVGTLSDEKGRFELNVQEYQKKDSLKIASIGYKTRVYSVSEWSETQHKKIQLETIPLQLEEVVIRSKKIKFKTLGTTRYTTNNCTGFADVGGNWKGSEAAILIRNKKDVLIESFSFFVIQNKYKDSLLFRLMFYEKIRNDWVGPTFLKKPIIFKVGIKQGEFTLPLRDYNIRFGSDFFVSLECLMDEMEISKFCYSGSVNVPSYYKVKAFSKWHSTAGTYKGGGGADFNVKVSYSE